MRRLITLRFPSLSLYGMVLLIGSQMDDFMAEILRLLKV